MRRFDATPWVRNAAGPELLATARTRLPVGFSLHMSATSPRGPFRIVLHHEGVVISDRWTRDIAQGIEDALSLSQSPSDLEQALAASLRRVTA